MVRHPKLNDASAEHAIGSIEELLNQVGDTITSNATEWGAGDEKDAAAHAIATVGVAIKLLILRVLPHFPPAFVIREQSLMIFMVAATKAIKQAEQKSKATR